MREEYSKEMCVVMEFPPKVKLQNLHEWAMWFNSALICSIYLQINGIIVYSKWVSNLQTRNTFTYKAKSKNKLPKWLRNGWYNSSYTRYYLGTDEKKERSLGLNYKNDFLGKYGTVVFLNLVNWRSTQVFHMVGRMPYS